ncbi:MAG: hypothetical protein ACE5IC_00030 [Candidatus Brocadiales bacterium]
MKFMLIVIVCGILYWIALGLFLSNGDIKKTYAFLTGIAAVAIMLLLIDKFFGWAEQQNTRTRNFIAKVLVLGIGFLAIIILFISGCTTTGTTSYYLPEYRPLNVHLFDDYSSETETTTSPTGYYYPRYYKPTVEERLKRDLQDEITILDSEFRYNQYLQSERFRFELDQLRSEQNRRERIPTLEYSSPDPEYRSLPRPSPMRPRLRYDTPDSRFHSPLLNPDQHSHDRSRSLLLNPDSHRHRGYRSPLLPGY